MNIFFNRKDKKNTHTYFFSDHFLLLINKQPGRTSHDEVARIKAGLKILGIKTKVGHSGTLDPKVTGLLVVGVGKATKLLGRLLESPKVYKGEIELHKPITREVLEQSIEAFLGEIQQLPPQRSSVKRALRTRSIYEMEILNFSPRKATIRCVVERGTYIRKLFHDMGEYMGIGASMGDLHRTDVAQFTIDDGRVVTSDAFIDACKDISTSRYIKRKKYIRLLQRHIVPSCEIVHHLPKIQLERGVERYLASGSDLYVPGVFSVPDDITVGDEVAIYQGAQLVALGIASMNTQDMRTKEKGVAVRTDKILIP